MKPGASAGAGQRARQLNADPLGGEKMRFAWAIAASLLALGCAGTGAAWPPHLDDARQHFEDHRAELDELADFVRENGLWVVSQSAVEPPAVGYRNPEMQQNQLTPDQASYVGALLQSTGVAGATRVDSIVYLDTGVGQVGTTHFRYGFMHAEVGSALPELCSTVDQSSAQGVCHVPLGATWSARYFWGAAQ